MFSLRVNCSYGVNFFATLLVTGSQPKCFAVTGSHPNFSCSYGVNSKKIAVTGSTPFCHICSYGVNSKLCAVTGSHPNFSCSYGVNSVLVTFAVTGSTPNYVQLRGHKRGGLRSQRWLSRAKQAKVQRDKGALGASSRQWTYQARAMHRQAAISSCTCAPARRVARRRRFCLSPWRERES